MKLLLIRKEKTPSNFIDNSTSIPTKISPKTSSPITAVEGFEAGKEASVRLGHKSLRTLMKRSSSWYLPGAWRFFRERL